MTQTSTALSIALFSEISTIDQLLKSKLSKELPKGMEVSHFSILNYFVLSGGEKTPVQLAKIFNLTKGAITNTLNKLLAAGYIHIRPDWDDGRKKFVSISKAGINARNDALNRIMPVVETIIEKTGREKAKMALPVLRKLRTVLDNKK